MRVVFLDSSFLIAILSPRDALRDRAIEVYGKLGKHTAVTSEMVLTEVLNSLSKYGDAIRKIAVEYVAALRKDVNVRIVPQTALLFERAVALYGQRLDKNWSLTDCASILMMQEQKIPEVLTNDEHFTQAGLTALLR